MNILYDSLPESVVVDGVEYPVYTDFRRWIELEVLLEEGISAGNAAKAIILCYKTLPKNLDCAIRGIAAFHSAGMNIRKKSASSLKKPIYSYKYDGGYIYGAFLEKYGIDLTSASLHWWQFCALLCSLGDCMFTRILQWRAVDISSIKSSAQKRVYRRLQNQYALPTVCPDAADSIKDLF